MGMGKRQFNPRKYHEAFSPSVPTGRKKKNSPRMEFVKKKKGNL
jgi:hypothetical protein